LSGENAPDKVGRMVRYDAAIIGAGANGLAAAAALAGAGHKVVVLERAAAPGGRCTTREFHPGFRASPFCDEVAPIPAEIFRALDLARHGAIFIGAQSEHPLLEDIRARGFADASRQPRRRWFGAAPDPAPWPGQDWSRRTLVEVSDDERALSGRAADPNFRGTALQRLASGGSGVPMGGLATLGQALASAARKAGAEISLGLEVADIRHHKQRATGVRLADGTEIEARAVISTLDLRRTFFSLFAWKDLPKTVTERVSAWRQTGSTARLLVALDAPPETLKSTYGFAQAHAAWRAGTVPEHLPMTLACVSAADPGLAPIGKAVVTATLGAIPHHLFDGPWTNEKRSALRDKALAQIGGDVLAAELIVPPDIEEALGVSEGDLDGGEIAPDQMFALRGFARCPGGRTPIAGLYLGGRASPLGPFGTCAAGIAASRAVIADFAR
jgi:phytoene dehydrogenase-like protein